MRDDTSIRGTDKTQTSHKDNNMKVNEASCISFGRNLSRLSLSWCNRSASSIHLIKHDLDLAVFKICCSWSITLRPL